MDELMSALVVAALFLFTACCATVPPPSPKQHTLRLEMEDGVCSATAVGPDEILTAKHCTSGRLRLLAGTPVLMIESRQIGQDMLLVKVDRHFDTWAQWADKKPEQGDRIYYWGNPVGIPDALRRGYIAGAQNGVLLVDVEVGRGDSGAAVFDESGRIVGVVSGFGVSEVFRMALIVTRKE